MQIKSLQNEEKRLKDELNKIDLNLFISQNCPDV